MGLSLREILKSEYFKDFKVLAGHGGLDKQVQGLAVLDAPDGFKWAQGKEFMITSGYVFYQNPGLLESFLNSEEFKVVSGVGIKLERYLKKIPDQHILEAFNEHNIPLIHIPLVFSWMDLITHFNVLIMNKNIRQFNIGNINPHSFSDLSYQVQKINKILSQIEREMGFPAMLYDFISEKAYYSSSAFRETADYFKTEDFWHPSFSHIKEILCDSLQMIRYKVYDAKCEKPYSWITMPITVGDKVEAYFVLIEARGVIDYADQFSLRTGFLLLQSVYEQILVAQSIGDMGFERFITETIAGKLRNHEVMAKRAGDLGLDNNAAFYLLLMKQINKEVHLSDHKEALKNAAQNSVNQLSARMAVVDDNSCVFLIQMNDRALGGKDLKVIKAAMEALERRLQSKIKNVSLMFGISNIGDMVYGIERNYARCERAIGIGRILFPAENYYVYSELGPFAWMDIKEDELDVMLKDLRRLLKEDEKKELVKTLKAYLDCQMNYSLTARQLFVHINTVRKRIDDIRDLLDLNLEDSMDRLKLEVLLKLF